MVKPTKCHKCVFLEATDQKGWHFCPKRNMKIHWKWAVKPPKTVPELSNCEFFNNKESNPFKCFNDPDLYRNL